MENGFTGIIAYLSEHHPLYQVFRLHGPMRLFANIELCLSKFRESVLLL